MTIRSVAANLDVAPMTLYSHISGKDDLLDAMLQLAFDDLQLPEDDGPPWDQRIEAILMEIYRVFEHHPSALMVAYKRGLTAQPLAGVREAIGAALLEGGFSTEAAALLFRVMGSYTVGFVFLQQQGFFDMQASDTSPLATQFPAMRSIFEGGDPFAAEDGFLLGIRSIIAAQSSRG